MQPRGTSDTAQIDEKLGRLIAELDVAIAQAVDNPLLFVNSPLLASLAATCTSVGTLGQSDLRKTYWLETERQAAENLLWGVRTRAGRLQRLLDAAANFYSTCFSPFEPDGLAYGVHGEWSATAGPRYLTVDC